MYPNGQTTGPAYGAFSCHGYKGEHPPTAEGVSEIWGSFLEVFTGSELASGICWSLAELNRS